MCTLHERMYVDVHVQLSLLDEETTKQYIFILDRTSINHKSFLTDYFKVDKYISTKQKSHQVLILK
jgi:hypothetical protein